MGDSRAPLGGTLLEEAVPYGLGCIQNRGQKGIKKDHMALGVPKTEAKGLSNFFFLKKRSPYGLGCMQN